MIDDESSLRLDLLRFPLIVGVVFIHTYDATVVFDGVAIGISRDNAISEYLRNLISQGIARTAVPIFFLMSGYLFFWGLTWTKENYFQKLRSRVSTLLVPFIFWNIATLLLIAIGQALPATQGYFSGKNPLIAGFTCDDYASAILGIGRSPIAYQFWFIRDLMLLILVTPITYYLNRVVPIPFLVTLFSCWVLNVWAIYAPSVEATLFFSIGCFLAQTRKNLFSFDKFGGAIVVLYAVVVTLDVLLIATQISPYLHKIGVAFGVLAVLFATKIVLNSKKLRRSILQLSSASFFVYAAHEPLLTITRKVTYKLFQPSSAYWNLALYFVIPALVIALLVVVFHILSRQFSSNARGATLASLLFGIRNCTKKQVRYD